MVNKVLAARIRYSHFFHTILTLKALPSFHLLLAMLEMLGELHAFPGLGALFSESWMKLYPAERGSIVREAYPTGRHPKR